VHAVAAQAVVHQEFLAVVLLVQKDFRVSSAVRAGGPIGVLLLVAIPAAFAGLQSVRSFQPDLLGHVPAKVVGQASNIVPMESRFQREHIPMAGRAWNISMRRGVPIRIGLPDFMATGAGLPLGIFVIKAPTRKRKQGDQQSDQEQFAKTWPVLFKRHKLLDSLEMVHEAHRGTSRRVAGHASAAESRAFPAFHQVSGGVIGDGHNGERWIEPPIRNVNAAIHDKKVIDVMHLAVSVDH